MRVWSLRKEPEHYFLHFFFPVSLANLFLFLDIFVHHECPKAAKAPRAQQISPLTFQPVHSTVFCKWKYCTALCNTSATLLCLVPHLETNRPLLAPVLGKYECMRLESPTSKSQIKHPLQMLRAWELPLLASQKHNIFPNQKLGMQNNNMGF